MKRRNFLQQATVGGVGAAAALPALAHGMSKSPKGPNLLFVMADQWRRQALGFMNDDPVLTPNLDRFAARSVRFNKAVSCTPVCTPDRAVLMTGQYPLTSGILANDMRMDEDAQSLGVVCKKAGYQTGYVGKWHIDGMRGFTPPGKRRQGWDFWYKEPNHAPFDQTYFIQDSPEAVRAPGTTWAPTHETDVAIDFMKRNVDSPFALVVSYGPPHNGGGVGMEDTFTPGTLDKDGNQKYGYGYKAPAEYEAPYRTDEFKNHPRRPNVKAVRKKFDSAPAMPGYFGAISSLDHEFGRLIDFLEQSNLLDNTVVIFTSDHGEMMGSQGLMTKCIWYEESIGVPCLIGGGGLKSQTVESPFNAVDVVPTLLGLMGVEKPPMDGTDFSPLLRGADFDAPEFAYLSFFKGGAGEVYRQWRAVYSERYTYVAVGDWPGWKNMQEIPQNGGSALYDRENDPYQMNPIYRGHGQDALMDKMHAALGMHLETLNDPFLENIWVGREDKTDAADKTARYDALIARYYKKDPLK